MVPNCRDKSELYREKMPLCHPIDPSDLDEYASTASIAYDTATSSTYCTRLSWHSQIRVAFEWYETTSTADQNSSSQQFERSRVSSIAEESIQKTENSYINLESNVQRNRSSHSSERFRWGRRRRRSIGRCSNLPSSSARSTRCPRSMELQRSGIFELGEYRDQPKSRISHWAQSSLRLK